MEQMPSLQKIREFYKSNRALLGISKQVIDCARIQDYEGVNQEYKELVRRLNGWMTMSAECADQFQGQLYFPDVTTISVTLEQLMVAQQSHDYVLLADYLELSLNPLFEKVFESLRSILPNPDLGLQENIPIPDDCAGVREDLKKAFPYELEETNSGHATVKLKDEDGFYYLHSNVDPVCEAKALVARYLSPEKDHYLVYGIGLGYHVRELLSSGGYLKVTVYESDLRMIRTALAYHDFREDLLKGRLRIIYDPELFLFSEAANCEENAGILIHAPSIRNCRHQENQNACKLFFAQESALKRCENQMITNFYQNVKNCKGYITELQTKFKDKTVVIVAAGPSLLTNIELLKEKPDDVVVLAVSTVYRKLLGLGIRPDFVIHLDAQAKTYSHLRGIEETAPLLVAATAYEGCARCYRGSSYLICQEGYDLSEQYAKEHCYPLFETGGSVATLALSVAISLQAKKVIMVGLDLAYTDGLAHAKGVSGQIPLDLKKAIRIPGYHGGEVESSVIFEGLIRWFNSYLARRGNRTCEVINATEGGAMIREMKQMPLKDALFT